MSNLTETNRLSWEALEWPTIFTHLQALVATPMGQMLLDALRPEIDLDRANQQLQQTAECRRYLQDGMRLRFIDCIDFRPYLHRTAKGGSLSKDELYGIGLTLASGNGLVATLKTSVTASPSRLTELLNPYQPLEEVMELFKQIFDARGEIRDDATPELYAIRSRCRSLNDNIHQRLKQLLSERFAEEVFQDDYVTVREDRLVLPLKSNMKGKLKGIIHGSSGTGHTFFIEPEEVVQANNEFKEVCHEEQIEIERLLRSTSEVMNHYQAQLSDNLEVLANLDLVHAKAQLSLQISGNIPKMAPLGSGFLFLQCRHPILCLIQKTVVANDIRIEPNQHVLLISGPNAGGKTVLLKSLGLNALIAAMGILPAVGLGSTVPLPESWLVETRDGQSIEAGLSTFSAQLKHLAHILKVATPGSWVLLDEIGTATDARQGEALAQAILEALAARGIKTILSTHFPQLKRLPHGNSAFVNASMETDAKSNRPTYRLLMGVAGESHAMEMAQSAGLSPLILQRARDLAAGAHSHLDALEETLRQEQRHLASLIAQTQQKNSALDEAKQKFALRLAELKEHEISALLPEQAELRLTFAESRRRLREIAAQLAPVKAAAIRKSLDRVQHDMRQAMVKAQVPHDDHFLQVGETVRWLESEQLALVTQPMKDDGSIEISSGIIRMKVHRDEVLWVPSAKAPTLPRPKPTAAKAKDARQIPAVHPTPQNTLDLRGHSLMEALTALETFLDRASLQGPEMLVIIHGHGTDKLKSGVRDFLEKTRYAVHFRPGGNGEGGSGVTIVQMER